MIRKALVDHASGSDNRVVSDADSGQNDGAGSNPDIVSNRNRVGVFQTAVTLRGIQGMTGSVETAVRSYENVLSETDRCTVEQHAVYVHIKIFTDFDVVAVVAVERLFDEEVVSSLSEQTAQQPVPFFHLGWA